MLHKEISHKQFQIDSLDGLRGFAALIVVFSHTSNSGMYFIPFLDLRGIGKSGVFLFFILSSFLLTLPLLDKGNKILTTPVMIHYWQRRFFRIYPLYILYLILGLMTTSVFSSFFGKTNFGIPFSLNFYDFIHHIFLLDGKGVTWSIAVEFKFYFILPFFALSIVYISSYGIGATALFFLTSLILSQIVFPESFSVSDDSRLLPYMPIFIIGMFLAYFQKIINERVALKNYLKLYKYLGYAGAAGIIIMTPLVFSLFGERVPNHFFHKQFILYAIFWSFILLSSINVRGVLQKFFELPILRYFGAISFSLYLFHPIFIMIFRYLKINGYLSAWIVLIISTISAHISFYFLERPFSKYKINRPSQKHEIDPKPIDNG